MNTLRKVGIAGAAALAFGTLAVGTNTAATAAQDLTINHESGNAPDSWGGYGWRGGHAMYRGYGSYAFAGCVVRTHVNRWGRMVRRRVCY